MCRIARYPKSEPSRDRTTQGSSSQGFLRSGRAQFQAAVENGARIELRPREIGPHHYLLMIYSVGEELAE